MSKKVVFLYVLVIFFGFNYLFDNDYMEITVKNKIFMSGADEAGFSDENFYNCIIDAYNEKNNSNLTDNDVLSDSQLATIDELICKGRNVSSIVGIEKLSNLTSLNLMENNLVDVDLSKNSKLMYVELSGNPGIVDIDLSKNIELREIYFRNDSLKSIDLSKNINLENLDLGANELTNISLVNNTKLKFVKLISNQLSSLDISKNINLIEFSAYNNYISNISLPNCDTMKILDLHNNKITNIDVSNYVNLEELSLSANSISGIDLSNNVNLEELYISSNNLDNLDISKLTKLNSLNAVFNNFDSLNISYPTNIINLAVEADWVNNFDFSNFSNLKSLRILDYKVVPIYGNSFDRNNLSNYKSSNVNYNEYVMYSGFNNRNSDYVVSSNSIKGELGSSSEYTICATNVSGYHSSCGEDIPNDVVLSFDDNVTVNDLNSYSNIIYYEGYRVLNFISISSDKYVIDDGNNTIDVGDDNDSDILNNINISSNDASFKIENNYLNVYYDDELIKSFTLLKISNPVTGSIYIYIAGVIFIISILVMLGYKRRKI